MDGTFSANDSSALIDSIVSIGQNCSLHLIAEGIEEDEQSMSGNQRGRGARITTFLCSYPWQLF